MPAVLANSFRQRNCPDVPALAHQIDDGPVFFALLEVVEGQSDRFTPPQPACEQEGEKSPVWQPASFSRVARVRSSARRGTPPGLERTGVWPVCGPVISTLRRGAHTVRPA